MVQLGDKNNCPEAVIAQKLPKVWGFQLFMLHCEQLGKLVEKATGATFGAAFNMKGQKLTMAFATKTNHHLQHGSMNLIDSAVHVHAQMSVLICLHSHVCTHVSTLIVSALICQYLYVLFALLWLRLNV